MTSNKKISNFIQNSKFKIRNLCAARGGQSLGEVLVGLTIGSILIGAASFLVVNSLRSNASLQKSQKATQIAQEMLDKVRSWGSADWFNTYNLSKGSTNKYFLNASSSELFVVNGEESILSEDITNGLLSNWKLDESTSTVAYDSSGNNNNGTLVNSPTRATSSCKIGGCLNFDGVNDSVSSLISGVTTYNQPLTMAMWLYIPSSFVWTNGEIGSFRATSYGLGIFRHATDNILVFTARIGGTATYGTQNYTIGRDTFYHLVFVGNGSTFDAYVNGTKINTTTKSYGVYAGSELSNDFRLATNRIYGGGGGGYLNGLIDDVRIYNRVLSAEEIKQIYQSSIYTRSFYVENTCRSTGATGEITGSGDSCAGGSANDPSTQKITVSVGWQTGVSSTQLMLNDYLTRWKNAIFEQADWSGGVDDSGSYTNSSDSYSSTTNTDLNSSGVILDLP